MKQIINNLVQKNCKNKQNTFSIPPPSVCDLLQIINGLKTAKHFSYFYSPNHPWRLYNVIVRLKRSLAEDIIYLQCNGTFQIIIFHEWCHILYVEHNPLNTFSIKHCRTILLSMLCSVILRKIENITNQSNLM